MHVVSAGLFLVLLAGCAREVPPGIATARARQAEAARQGADVDITRYHAAARASETGQVSGRVYEERRKPDGADIPLAGTVLMVVPRSESWLSELESIRAQSRDSLTRYRETAPAVRRAREALERALLERGGGDLPQSVAVKEDGTFALPPLPAGDWVLIAAYTEPGTHSNLARKMSTEKKAKSSAGATVSDRFLPRPTLVGHDYVTLWLREITVRPGVEETIALTPRNAWLTAVVEDRETPVFRVSPPVAGAGSPVPSSNTSTPSPSR